MFASLLATLPLFAFTSVDLPVQPRIVGGQESPSCHFPGAVLISKERRRLCTGTLVHPKIVTTAGHCVNGEVVFGFGERGQYKKINGSCKESPEHTDMAYCLLEEEVNDVPIVPILMGCELDALQKDHLVTLVGFGDSADANGDGGIKRQVQTPIHAAIGEGGVAGEEILLGHAEKGSCNGDSGGPAYIDLRQIPGFKDRQGAGWRVFGATSRKGPGGGNCASTTVYGVLARMVPWIEKDSGIDITPCHDADGTWNPGSQCQGGSDPKAGGEWPQCEAGEPSGQSKTCEGRGKGTQTPAPKDDPPKTKTPPKQKGKEGSSQDKSEKPEKSRDSGCSLTDSPHTGWLSLLLFGLVRRRR